jgi:hypothetical protein
MTLFRVKHNKNYTCVNNFICTDNRLSWKAKGIWLYAFSRPDDWQFYLNDLVKQSTEGKDAVKAGLKELMECGYLVKIQKREEGKFSSCSWEFFETPQFKEKSTKVENPSTVKSSSTNPPLLSTKEKQSTEINKDTKVSKETAEAVEMTDLFLKMYKEINPKRKTPEARTVSAWTKSMDIMLRNDGVTTERIRAILKWLPTNWWKKNILSVPKLRLEFVRLEEEKEAEEEKASKTTISKDFNLNRKWVNEVYDKHPKLEKKITIKSHYVIFKGTSRELCYNSFEHERFKELFVELVRRKDP